MTDSEFPQIKVLKFGPDLLVKVSSFECGEEVWSVFAAEWIKETSIPQCAIVSAKKHGTKVWLFTQGSDVVGFGSAGSTKIDGRKVSFLPMLAIDSKFQGRTYRDGKKYSYFVLEFVLKKLCEQSSNLICLYVDSDNVRAIKLYERFSFSVAASFERHGREFVVMTVKKSILDEFLQNMGSEE